MEQIEKQNNFSNLDEISTTETSVSSESTSNCSHHDLSASIDHDNVVKGDRKTTNSIEPATWKQLLEIRENGRREAYSQLRRSEIQQSSYDHFRKKLRMEWKSLDDYILCSKFYFGQRQDEKGLRYAFPSLSEYQEEMKMQVIAVSKNDFPYYVSDDIEHWVLWKLGGPCTLYDIIRAKHIIQCQHLSSDHTVEDFVCFANPKNLKSIPDIHHVQIFCLKRKKGN